MRVQSLSPNFSVANSEVKVYKQKHSQVYCADSFEFMPKDVAKMPISVISFRGANDGDKALYIGAELPPYWKKGGVATVMNDYPGPHIIPYYNGKIHYDPKTGKPIKESGVEVHKLSDGTPIFTNQDLNVVSMEEVEKKGNYFKLEPVATKTMQWGLDPNDEIVLYKVVPKDADIAKAKAQGRTLPEHFMVFTDATAKMPGPYADNSYSFGFKKELASDVHMWQGDPYAKFGKAVVELIPAIKGDYKTAVLSDSQSAYSSHWLAEKITKGDVAYSDIRPSYVEHNIAPGYTGATSNRNMFVNLASTEQIKAVLADPDYLNSLKNGNVEEYFMGFVQRTHDALKSPNATMIALNYHDQGFVKAATAVSEEYAYAAATNPMVAPELTGRLASLKEQGKGGGILNPLNDPNVNPYKSLPLPGYGKDLPNIEVNGVKETIPAMKIFSPEMDLSRVNKIKRENKINLFNRLSGKYKQSEVLTGLQGKKVQLLGNIDKKWIDALKSGKDVKLFVSWGRGDLQKGLDLALASFEKFAKTEAGKNSVLVLGGELDNTNPESKNIRMKVAALLNDSSLRGRLCFMDGFAPGYALASAGDAAIFPSRFAPCELTDLESQKYFCTPIVTNTQGLAQKNFDPRIAREAKIATSYKTTNEFQMGHSKLAEVSPEFKKEYESLLEAEKIKLKNKGVYSVLVDELAAKNVLGSAVMEGIYRDCADNILVGELADCMHQKVTQPAQTAELIYQNHKKLKTGWAENGALHPDGKSSWQLYREKHFNSKSEMPKESMLTFDEGIVRKYKKTLLAENESSITKFINGFKKLSKGSKIAVAAGGATLLWVAVSVFMKNNIKESSVGSPNNVGEPLLQNKSDKYSRARVSSHEFSKTA